jgi:DNA-binding response OmpR family regulator
MSMQESPDTSTPVPPARLPREEAVETAAEVTSRPVKILVVDDEPNVTGTIRRYLSFEGYDVDVVNDPYSALRMVHKENYLVVITDISMPGMNGVELLGRIKDYNGMIQVIVITGHVTIENILSCLRLGADDCFLKPLGDMAQLGAAVEEAVRKLKKWNTLMGELIHGKRETDDG